VEGVQFLHVAEKSLFEWWTEFTSALVIQSFTASLLPHLNCLIKGECLCSKLFKMLFWNMWCRFMLLWERLPAECHINHCWIDHSQFCKRLWNLYEAGEYQRLQERFSAKFGKWSLVPLRSIPPVMEKWLSYSNKSGLARWMASDLSDLSNRQNDFWSGLAQSHVISSCSQSSQLELATRRSSRKRCWRIHALRIFEDNGRSGDLFFCLHWIWFNCLRGWDIEITQSTCSSALWRKALGDTILNHYPQS